MSAELCTSNTILKNGAWCLRDTVPASEFAPGHRLALHQVPADIRFTKELIKLIGNETDVVDFGAGLGQYGVRFAQLGRTGKYTALDGALNIEDFTANYVLYADLTKPLHFPATWVLSLQIGEHFLKQFERNYLFNLVNNAKVGIVLKWALAGHGGGGHGHVNERSNEYVINQLARLGFAHDAPASFKLRQSVFSPHLYNTTMVFRRRKHAG